MILSIASIESKGGRMSLYDCTLKTEWIEHAELPFPDPCL